MSNVKDHTPLIKEGGGSSQWHQPTRPRPPLIFDALIFNIDILIFEF